MHQSIPAAPSPPSPPGLLRGICPPCQSRGWGICKFCTARGLGICQPQDHSWAFDTHAVTYQNITTRRFYWKKKADWLICQGEEYIEEASKGMLSILCMHIKPELHSENRSYWCESMFFRYWIKFLFILFEERPFIFVKLFMTYKVTALY